MHIQFECFYILYAIKIIIFGVHNHFLNKWMLNQQECIKLIERVSKDIYNASKDLYFK